MSDIKAKVGQQNSIKLRVGQQNTVKVISSISGSAGGQSVTSENVVGGIASVRQLHVSGISTFVGVSTFKNDVYIDGDLYIGDDLIFDEFTARNGRITGILTSNNLNVTGAASFVGIATFNNVYMNGLYYGPYFQNGMSYFNSSGLLVSTQSPQNGIDYTNYIMTTDNTGTPAWSNAIEGGFY